MPFLKIFEGDRGSIMKIYRIMEYLKQKKIPIIPGLLMRYIRVIYSCELPVVSKMGKGVYFLHSGLGVVIHPDAIIGESTIILQNVTIGGRNDKFAPTIGENVFIGCGACILGGITIGNNVMIGANAVVITDIPDGSVVVGVPGKVVKTINGKQ